MFAQWLLSLGNENKRIRYGATFSFSEIYGKHDWHDKHARNMTDNVKNVTLHGASAVSYLLQGQLLQIFLFIIESAKESALNAQMPDWPSALSALLPLNEWNEWKTFL